MDTEHAKVQELANRAALAGESETAAVLRMLSDERYEARTAALTAIDQKLALTAERDTLKALCDKVREIVEQRQHDPAVRDGSDPGGFWAAGYNVCQKQIVDELKAALKTCDTRARSILK